MTRAVIKLSVDISPVMRDLSRLIEGCAYSPEAPGMAFRVGDMRVIVERNTITVLNTEDAETARAVMDWLVDLVNGKVDIMYHRRDLKPEITPGDPFPRGGTVNG